MLNPLTLSSGEKTASIDDFLSKIQSITKVCIFNKLHTLIITVKHSKVSFKQRRLNVKATDPKRRPCPQMWHKTMFDEQSKHCHIGAKSSLLWLIKYAKMRFRTRMCLGPTASRWGPRDVPQTSSRLGGDTRPHAPIDLVGHCPQICLFRTALGFRKSLQKLCRVKVMLKLSNFELKLQSIKSNQEHKTYHSNKNDVLVGKTLTWIWRCHHVDTIIDTQIVCNCL